MRPLTQALTLGLAQASISAFERRNRMVIVFVVTQHLYHSFHNVQSLSKGFPKAGIVKTVRG